MILTPDVFKKGHTSISLFVILAKARIQEAVETKWFFNKKDGFHQIKLKTLAFLRNALFFLDSCFRRNDDGGENFMVETRLQELNICLPSQPASVAQYMPFVKVGSLVFISGQLPFRNGELSFIGKVGRDFTLEEGQEAARMCALNILVHLKTACEEDLNRVTRCIRLGGFVNSTDGFQDQPKVMNGASDLIISVFGEKGRHARMAVGVNALPLGAAVEVEAIFEVQTS